MTSITVKFNTLIRYHNIKIRFTQHKKKIRIPHDDFLNHLLDLNLVEMKKEVK